MKYFRRIACDLDVAPALAEVAQKGSILWSMNHGQNVENALRGYRGNANPEGTRTVPWEQFPSYPAVSRLLSDAMERLPSNVTLERSRIRILPPNSAMKAHRDTLAPNARRYQVCLQAGEAAFFTIKQEKCRFKAGELWLCDIRDRLHFVDNRSALPRVVLVIDGFV